MAELRGAGALQAFNVIRREAHDQLRAEMKHDPSSPPVVSRRDRPRHARPQFLTQLVCLFKMIKRCHESHAAQGHWINRPSTGSIGRAVHSARNLSRYCGHGCCGTFTTTTANPGNRLRARDADSPKSWSRVSRQRKPDSTATLTRSPFESAFHPRFPAVSQEIPKPLRTGTRCTSIFASSSHMEGIGELGRDLQNLGQSLPWKRALERRVDVVQRHSIR